MYDAIVVGARCAGSPTAMLLARKGYRVLLTDKASFPSDTISTHIVWPRGAELLRRWGLLDRVAATGAPPICHTMALDLGPFALQGAVLDANQGEGGFCPRRTVLDEILFDAAAESGAEVREGFTIEDLLVEGDTVVGIRGRGATGQPVEERARIVVGADGVHSRIAHAVHAPEYDTHPVLTCAYYSYFSGVHWEDARFFLRDHCAVGAVPTNDDLVMLVANWPAARFAEVRADVEGHMDQVLAMAPSLGERVHDGRREERWFGTAGIPNYFRKPYGSGWALVGDAGYARDPMTAQGISDSFVDAESLTDAIDAGLAGRRPLDEALAEHEAQRNNRVRPMYEFTQQIASLDPPPPEMQQLFGAMYGNQEATNQFLSAITGSLPLPEFMSEENLGRIMSVAAGR